MIALRAQVTPFDPWTQLPGVKQLSLARLEVDVDVDESLPLTSEPAEQAKVASAVARTTPTSGNARDRQQLPRLGCGCFGGAACHRKPLEVRRKPRSKPLTDVPAGGRQMSLEFFNYKYQQLRWYDIPSYTAQPSSDRRARSSL